MARPVKWLNLLLSLPLLLLVQISYAQLLHVDSVETSQEIIAFSTDRTGNLFLGLSGGTIQKYDGSLDSLESFNPRRVGDFSLI